MRKSAFVWKLSELKHLKDLRARKEFEARSGRRKKNLQMRSVAINSFVSNKRARLALKSVFIAIN